MKLSELKKIMENIPENADLNDAAWRSSYLRSLGLEPGGIYQELEMQSRYVDTHRDYSDASTPVDLHSHSFYELLYCRSCDRVEYLIGTERYRLRRGDVVMVPPGTGHRPLLPEDMHQPYIRDVLWVSTEFMQQLYHYDPELFGGMERFSTLLVTEGSGFEELGVLFEKGLQEAQSCREDSELLVIANTVTLLLQLRRACISKAAKPLKAEKPELLDRIMGYVQTHLSDRITLNQIAKHFYVSESTVSQAFRSRMNVSFYRYVTQRRLIEAKRLIEENENLEDVAAQVGFSDYSAFYRAFKQEYGICPRQYRKMGAADPSV